MVDSIKFLFPNYGFLIGGLIIAVVVALIVFGITHDIDEHPILMSVAVFAVIFGASAILHGVYNQNNKRKNTLAINEAISVNEQCCGEKLSNINAYINERNNTLINLADIVKSYDEYESKTIIEMVKAKSGISYTAVLSRLNETYPQLRSIENYNKLISELEKTEANLRESRTDYNRAVRCYNSIISNHVYTDYIGMTGQYIPKKYLEEDVTGDYEAIRFMKE